MGNPSPVHLGLLVSLTLLFAGCSTEKRTAVATLPLPVEVRADTSGGQVLDVRLPAVAAETRVWVSSVAPSRRSQIDVELPDAPLDTMIPASPPPPLLEIDDDLKPPILRAGSVLRVPLDRGRRRVETVELDVRVDEAGAVTDALWAGGSADSMLVQAATECALGMKFYPALQSGRAVPVWCRQRFDFSRGEVRAR